MVASHIKLSAYNPAHQCEGLQLVHKTSSSALTLGDTQVPVE